MSIRRPDPTFYPSPQLAMKAPPERRSYVASFDPECWQPDVVALHRQIVARVIDVVVDRLDDMTTHLILPPERFESEASTLFRDRNGAGHQTQSVTRLDHLIRDGAQMVKCNADQVRRLQRALKREKNPKIGLQMVLLRESGMTQPEIANATAVSLSTVNRTHMAYDRGGRGRWHLSQVVGGSGKT